MVAGLQKILYLYPEKKAFIDSYNSTDNLSKSNHLFLGFFRKKIIYRILLEYDLKNILYEGSVVEANLELYCIRNDYIDKKMVFSVHPLLSEWDDSTVSFSSQPSFDASIKKQVSVYGSLHEYINFDVTEYVQQWESHPERNFGVLVKAEDEKNEESFLGVAGYRQGNLEWRPRLRIKIIAAEQRDNLSPSPKIAILTPQFFQMHDNRCLLGGGERYLIDLVKLLQKIGYQVDVFQATNGETWKRTYDGVSIYGIGEEDVDKDFYIGVNKAFIEAAQNYNYHIYFNMDMIYPYVFPGSICISHGIWWDSMERDWWRSRPWYERLFKGLNSVDVLVSVDTNTINWINAVNPNLPCKKVYIPNYVDLNMFTPDPEDMSKNYIKILYPRRLCSARGWDVCKELAVELTQEYYNLIFSFVGRGGTDNLEKHMEVFSARHPRVEYRWLEMNEMYKAYKDTDIVLIPSLYSEGTSLSLLEAMACGKPVIAGLVGGLTDLVIQGYNGYLIEVDKDNLKKAIVELIKSPDLRKAMGKNARSMSLTFSKEIWEDRWKSVLLDQFPISK